MKPHNLGNRFRQARMQRFMSLVGPLLTSGRKVRILDLGGSPGYWHALPGLYGLPNVEITVVNIDETDRQDENLMVRNGDATAMPDRDMSFDVVHSNSLVEHVGKWPEMQAMAREVRRLAPRYFVQTPNYWFPLEPHFRLPLVQFIPERLRAAIIEALGRNPHPRDTALECVRGTRLLSARQMRRLFPDASIERERFAGLTKALIAVRS